MLTNTRRKRWRRSKLAQRQKPKRATSSRKPLEHGEVGSCYIPFAVRANGAPDIDLTGLIPQLDTVASDLVAHQRDTLTQRKDLAQKTKDFRKLDDASKLSDIKGLLKCEHNDLNAVKLCRANVHSVPELH